MTRLKLHFKSGPLKGDPMRLWIAATLCAVCAIACGAGDDDDSSGSGGMSATGGAQAQSGAGAASGGRPATGGASAMSGAGGMSVSGGTGGGGKAPADAGGMINADAGAMSDAGDDASTGLPEPQDLPEALRQAGVLALFPAPNAEQVCPDPPLHMLFSAKPTLGAAGKVQVFDVAQPGTAVATLDMAKAMTTVSVDGTTYNVPRTAYVDGNDAALYLPAHALKYGHEYFVHIDAGAVTGPNADALSIADDTTWRFRTAAAAPGDVSTLKVALDGSGAFCTVQGAVDATSGQSTIAIARGTYHEIVHFRSKNGMTLRGADRKATIIAGTNNENLNGGTAKRALVGVDASTDVVFENLTIHNVTPQDGSQAEALRMQNCEKCIVRNADIISLQDTLLWSGRIYARDCYIAGNVDFIWGTGAAYFDHCEIKTLGRKGYNVQARNGASGYGYVFVDSKLTSDPGITGNLLGRVDASAYPASHVAYIDCEMGSHIAPVGWQVTGIGTSGLRFWEYQSKSPSGTPIDTSQRLSGVGKQLTSQEAAMMRDKSVVLGGWSPQ